MFPPIMSNDTVVNRETRAQGIAYGTSSGLSATKLGGVRFKVKVMVSSYIDERETAVHIVLFVTNWKANKDLLGPFY